MMQKWLPPSYLLASHTVRLKIVCVFRCAQPNIRQGKQTLVYPFIYLFFLSIIFENSFLKRIASAFIKVECIFWCCHRNMKCNCLITWLYIMPFVRYLPCNKAIAFHISMTAPKYALNP